MSGVCSGRRARQVPQKSMVSAEVKKAKTVRGQRAMEKRAPKINENPRTALIARGQKTSEMVNAVLVDLFMLKKPYSLHFKRHNAVHPFEDATPLEFLCQKNDASLFAFGTHSKKRPNNLVLGRMFDHRVLDMVELGIEAFQPMGSFPEVGGGSTSESKPCLLFSGEEWEHDPNLSALRRQLVDFFHLEVVDAISPLGIEHFLSFTVSGGKICMRHYLSRLLKSAEGTAPHVALTEMGPSLDLVIRRTQQPSEDVMKVAMKRPKAVAAAPAKVKNITRSKLHGKQGRLHMPRQDLSQMATAKMKAFKKPRRTESEGAPAGAGGSQAGPSKRQKK